MAAPHVAGLAALTLSSNPDLTARQLRQLLATTTTGQVSGSDSRGLADAKATIGVASSSVSVSTATSTVAHNALSVSDRYSVRDVAAIDLAVREATETNDYSDELLDFVYATQIGDLAGGDQTELLSSFAATTETASAIEREHLEGNHELEETDIDAALRQNWGDLA